MLCASSYSHTTSCWNAATLQVSKATQPFFSLRVTTTDICQTKNTLKETASARLHCTLIATSPILISLSPPAPPSATMSWENSKDNSSRPQTLQISEQEITADPHQTGKGEKDGRELKQKTIDERKSIIMEMRILN